MDLPKITNRDIVNEVELRFFAVILSKSKEDKTVNLPLANAITSFVLKGTWNVGAGYDKEYLEKILKTPDEPSR